jgi:glycosyltransferase involved in cell wall biosynthesis
MEAMAWGIPVVVSDIPGNRDLVTDGQTGLLFPVGDPTQLAALTRRVLDEPQWARQLGQAARAWMQQEFSVEKMVERYMHLYQSIAQG